MTCLKSDLSIVGLVDNIYKVLMQLEFFKTVLLPEHRMAQSITNILAARQFFNRAKMANVIMNWI